MQLNTANCGSPFTNRYPVGSLYLMF